MSMSRCLRSSTFQLHLGRDSSTLTTDAKHRIVFSVIRERSAHTSLTSPHTLCWFPDVISTSSSPLTPPRRPSLRSDRRGPGGFNYDYSCRQVQYYSFIPFYNHRPEVLALSSPPRLCPILSLPDFLLSLLSLPSLARFLAFYARLSCDKIISVCYSDVYAMCRNLI